MTKPVLLICRKAGGDAYHFCEAGSQHVAAMRLKRCVQMLVERCIEKGFDEFSLLRTTDFAGKAIKAVFQEGQRIQIDVTTKKWRPA